MKMQRMIDYVASSLINNEDVKSVEKTSETTARVVLQDGRTFTVRADKESSMDYVGPYGSGGEPR